MNKILSIKESSKWIPSFKYDDVLNSAKNIKILNPSEKAVLLYLIHFATIRVKNTIIKTKIKDTSSAEKEIGLRKREAIPIYWILYTYGLLDIIDNEEKKPSDREYILNIQNILNFENKLYYSNDDKSLKIA